MQYVDIGNFLPPKGKFVKNYFQDQIRAALTKADTPLKLRLAEEYSGDDPLSAGQWKRCYVFVEFTNEVKKTLAGMSFVHPDSDTRRYKLYSSRDKIIDVDTTGSRMVADINSALASVLSGGEEEDSTEDGNFYHVSSKRYKPGATIKGYWSSMEDEDPLAEVSMEDLEEELEAARPPDAVSRRGAVFLFTSMADAVSYRNSLKSGSKIYVVEPVGNTTRADMRGVDAILQAMDDAKERKTKAEIKRYWSGKPNGSGFKTMWEVMATSAKVIKQVPEKKNESVQKSLETLTEAVYRRLLRFF